MKNSLPMQLKSILRSKGDWLSKNEICRFELRTSKEGLYGADLISRTLRSMEEESIIAVKHINGYSNYKYLPDYIQSLYIPTSRRAKDDEMFKDKEEVYRLLSVYKKP